MSNKLTDPIGAYWKEQEMRDNEIEIKTSEYGLDPNSTINTPGTSVFTFKDPCPYNPNTLQQYLDLIQSYGTLSWQINNKTQELKYLEETLINVHNNLTELIAANPGIDNS